MNAKAPTMLKGRKAKLVKLKRKPGEKKRVHRTMRPLSPFSDPRKPRGYNRMAEFVISCEGEVSVHDAIIEYQNEWCDHPHSEQSLISTHSRTDEPYYQVACGECGAKKKYKGSPPGRLTR